MTVARKRGWNLTALLLYLLCCMIPLFVSVDPMWTMWAHITFTGCVIQFIYVLCAKEFLNYHVIIYPMIPLLLLTLFGLVVVALPEVRQDNQNRVNVNMIPVFEQAANKWCSTTCPSTNNLTFTCSTFNNGMLQAGSAFQDVMPKCLERAVAICDKIIDPAMTCAFAWSNYNYALINNDSNTEPQYRLVVNLIYGSLLSFATTLCYVALFTFVFRKLTEPPYISVV